MNRLLGAQHFTLYNYSMGAALLPYIRSYQAEGLVDLVPWGVPVRVDVWPPDPLTEPEVHYFAQLGALNDCLYRNMARSRFIVYSDLDEFIAPSPPSLTWMDMLEAVSTDFIRQHK